MNIHYTIKSRQKGLCIIGVMFKILELGKYSIPNNWKVINTISVRLIFCQIKFPNWPRPNNNHKHAAKFMSLQSYKKDKKIENKWKNWKLKNKNLYSRIYLLKFETMPIWQGHLLSRALHKIHVIYLFVLQHPCLKQFIHAPRAEEPKE